MSMVYVVMGTTGEYSDRTEWSVAAYTDEDMAKAHVEGAGNWCRAHFSERPKYNDRHNEDGTRKNLKNPFDSEMEIDYTGTTWFYLAVPLLTALPVV